jgi:hypothetical protein
MDLILIGMPAGFVRMKAASVSSVRTASARSVVVPVKDHPDLFCHHGIKSPLLIPQAILTPAVRALPGDAVAGHAPEIFLHAILADGEPTPASPAE